MVQLKDIEINWFSSISEIKNYRVITCRRKNRIKLLNSNIQVKDIVKWNIKKPKR